ncbi:hypothetical protein [Streptomyces sp. NPDC126499]|uniref:hypothetical protein n=1 Tax=Streptomyces sp. NPDC126499 TaxID=3155314 RepID=UPI00331AB55C
MAEEAYEELTGGSEAFRELVANGHGDRLPDPEAPPYEEPLEAEETPRLVVLFPATGCEEDLGAVADAAGRVSR